MKDPYNKIIVYLLKKLQEIVPTQYIETKTASTINEIG